MCLTLEQRRGGALTGRRPISAGMEREREERPVGILSG